MPKRSLPWSYFRLETSTRQRSVLGSNRIFLLDYLTTAGISMNGIGIKRFDVTFCSIHASFQALDLPPAGNHGPNPIFPLWSSSLGTKRVAKELSWLVKDLPTRMLACSFTRQHDCASRSPYLMKYWLYDHPLPSKGQVQWAKRPLLRHMDRIPPIGSRDLMGSLLIRALLTINRKKLLKGEEQVIYQDQAKRVKEKATSPWEYFRETEREL